MTDRKPCIIVTVAILLVMMVYTPESARAQDNGAFKELTGRFEQGKIFKAGFTHIYIDSYTGDTLKSNGEIWVGEKRYKVRSKSQTVVVDGKTSMVYDEERNRVIISKYEPSEDDFAPSRILNGIDTTFAVETQRQKNRQIIIKLTSDDPFAVYQTVRLYLNDPTLIPTKIEAKDPADNLVITTFENGAFIKVSQGMFSLNYPSTAEIVDMRN